MKKLVTVVSIVALIVGCFLVISNLDMNSISTLKKHNSSILKTHSEQEHHDQIHNTIRDFFVLYAMNHKQDAEAEQCLKSGVQGCVPSFVNRLRSRSPDEIQAVVGHLKQQAERFKQFADSLSENASWNQIDSYFEQHLSNDPETGTLWRCVQRVLHQCINQQSFAFFVPQSPRKKRDTQPKEINNEQSFASYVPQSPRKKRDTQQKEINIQKQILSFFSHDQSNGEGEDGEGEDGQDCMSAGIKHECVPGFIKKVSDLPMEQRMAIVMKVKSQSEAFEKWAQDHAEGGNWKAMDDYFEQNLTGDEDTGDFWKCAQSVIHECADEGEGEDGMGALLSRHLRIHLNKFHKQAAVKQHKQEGALESDGEDCMSNGIKGDCLPTFIKSLAGMSEEDRKEVVGRLQKQSAKFEQWSKTDGESAGWSELDDFFEQNLESDGETGDFWTCVLKVIHSCANEGEGEDSLFLMNKFTKLAKLHVQAISAHHAVLLAHKSIPSHLQDEETEQCIKGGVQGCIPTLISRLQSVPEERRQEIVDRIKSQAQAFKSYAETLGEDASWSDIQNYFSQHLTNDQDTGAFWQCVENTIQKCAQQQESYFFMQVFHKDDGEAMESCFRQSGSECKEVLRNKIENMSDGEIEALENKFRQQAAPLEQFGHTLESGDIDKIREEWQNIKPKFENELNKDPETGDIWSCFYKAINSCVDSDGESDGEDDGEDDGESSLFFLQTRLRSSVSFLAKFHAQENDDAKECIKAGAKGCVPDLISKLQALDPSDRLEAGEKLKSQAEDLKTYAESLNEADGEANIEKMKQYFSENLTSDPVTGEFWQCVWDSIQKCAGGESFFFLQDSLQFLATKHAQEDGEIEQCIKSGGRSCAQDLMSKISALSDGEQMELAFKLKSQAEGLKEQFDGEQDDAAALEKMKSYFDEHLVNDPDTGDFWQCVWNAIEHCAGSQDQFYFIQQNIQFLASKHAQEDGEIEECIKSGGRSCAQDLMSKIQALSDGEQMELAFKLKSQAEDLKEQFDGEQDDAAALQKMKSYFDEHLVNDPDTGDFWQCVWNAIEHCAGSQDQFYFIQYNIQFLASKHAQEDGEIEECIKSGGRICAQDLMSKISALSDGEQMELASKLKSQAEGLKEQFDGEQDDAAALEKMKSYFDEHLVNDPDTGDFWQCVWNAIEHCAGSQDQFYFIQQNIQFLASKHAEDGEIEECIKQGAHGCARDLFAKLSQMPMEDRMALVTKLKSQGEAMKTYGDSLDGDSKEEGLEKMKKYFDDNLVDDADTGDFWKCVWNAIENCTGDDSLLATDFTNFISLHASSDEQLQAEKCMEEQTKDLVPEFLKQISSQPQNTRMKIVLKLKQQGQQLDEWRKSQHDEVEPSKVAEYFKQNLSNDSLTGFFWSGYEKALETCMQQEN